MPNKRHRPPAVQAKATVILHKEGEQDEPLGLDVDVTVTCDCGAASTARREILKEDDYVSMMCDACGATYRVDVSTVIGFVAKPVKESGSVLGGPRAT